LEAKNEAALLALTVKAENKEIDFVAVREPDINDGLTAVVFVPGEKNRSFLANLPCLGKKDPRQAAISASKEDILSAKALGWQSRNQGEGLTYAVGWMGPVIDTDESWEDHVHNSLCTEGDCWHENFRTTDAARARETSNRWGTDCITIAVNPFVKEGAK